MAISESIVQDPLQLTGCPDRDLPRVSPSTAPSTAPSAPAWKLLYELERERASAVALAEERHLEVRRVRQEANSLRMVFEHNRKKLAAAREELRAVR